MSKIDVLNFEWTSKGRDIHIIEPVLCYLESKGYSVTRESYLFFLWKIIYYRPQMLVLSNNVGSIRNFVATKFAYKLGIKTVTLCSEGDYCVLDSDDSIDSFFWGWDLDRDFPVDLHLEWSQKNIALIQEFVSRSDIILDRTRVSGATGFDRYKMLSFKSRKKFVNQYNLHKYNKIVGYAAWGFDALYDKAFCQAATFNRTDNYVAFHKENRRLLREILKQIIVSNPDVLFILKRHPGELLYEKTELSGLEVYNNVLVFMSEETIEDLINVCDLWMAYESTTCMEAWLMNKQTVLINPLPFDSARSEIFKGSPVRTDTESLQKDIDTGIVAGFDELRETRKELINKIVGFSDGKSYVRAGTYIIEELKKPNRSRRLDGWCVKQIFKETIKASIYYTGLKKLPMFKRFIEDCINFEKIYSKTERDIYTKKYADAIEKADNIE